MSARREIRFCTSADGVQLAAAIYGSGPPFIKAATWLTHIEQVPDGMFDRAIIDEFSRAHTYIEYDARGCGLSQRRVDEISLDAWVRDLEAVADAFGHEPFPLLGFSCGVAVAVAYAARHPERVSHLILAGGFATSYFTTGNPDPAIEREAQTLLQVAEVGWGNASPAFRQVFVSKFMPNATPEQWRLFDERQRITATPEVAVCYLRAMFEIDIKAIAPKVRAPTLVFHVKGDHMVRFDQGRKLAALIPGARFVPLEGENHVPFPDEAAWHAFVQEVRPFLGTAPRSNPSDPDATLKLTARQREVLRLVAEGRTDKEIARTLSLSPRTVEMHVGAALKALGCRTRAEAARRATEWGLFRA